MNNLLENKRRLAGILGFLLIVISLALGFLTKNNETMNYIDIIFPQNIFHGMFQAFLYVIYPILILSVILVIINFTSKRRIILYTILSIYQYGLGPGRVGSCWCWLAAFAGFRTTLYFLCKVLNYYYYMSMLRKWHLRVREISGSDPWITQHQSLTQT